MFVNTQAAIVHRVYDHETCYAPASFDSETLFPPKDASLVMDVCLVIQRENVETKTFVFSDSDLSTFRDEYADH